MGRRGGWRPGVLAMAVVVCAWVGGCAHGNPPGQATAGGTLGHLAEWMQGDFDNTRALADPARVAVEEHVPIQVHLRALPGIENGLYIQQASMQAPDRPYRQRVYILREAGAGFVSEVWTLRDPASFVNAHDDPGKLAAIGPGDIEHKDGCDVHLAWDGTHYVGGTVGEGCESTLGGAAYATAEVVIHADGFTSLDRGFNTAGEQVWGAEKLPYAFTRRGTE